MFITVFTGTYHWTLSWVRWSQSTPCFHKIYLNVILFHFILLMDSLQYFSYKKPW